MVTNTAVRTLAVKLSSKYLVGGCGGGGGVCKLSGFRTVLSSVGEFGTTGAFRVWVSVVGSPVARALRLKSGTREWRQKQKEHK